MNGEKDKCWWEVHCKKVQIKDVFGKCVYLTWFVYVKVVGNQGHVSLKCIH